MICPYCLMETEPGKYREGFFQVRIPLPTPLNRRFKPVTRYKMGRTPEAKKKDHAICEAIAATIGRKKAVPLEGECGLVYTIYQGTRIRHDLDIDAIEKALLDCIHPGEGNKAVSPCLILDDNQVTHVAKSITEIGSPDSYVIFDLFSLTPY